jgi:tetratricopeptide (TPR) repeat protein
VHVQLHSVSERSAPAALRVSSVTSYAIPKEAAKAFDQGVADLRKNDWKKAEKHFKAATDRYPKFDRAYDYEGIAKQNDGDIPGAKLAYQKALELNDHSADALRNLARILESEKNWPAAADLLSKSLAVEPNNAGSLTLLAIAQIEQGKLDDATSNASRVHALEHKSYAVAHLVLARAYEMKAHNSDAIEQYRMYLTEEPTGPRSDVARKIMERLSQGMK